MKKYEEYTALDFVKDDAFRDWVQGNGRGEGFWMHFLQQHPEKRADIRQAELLIRSMNVTPEQLSEKEIRNEVNRFLEKVNTVSEKTIAELPRRWWQRSAYQFAAAIAAVFITISAWWLTDSTKKQLAIEPKTELSNSLAEAVNDTERPLKLTLDDGSLVSLSPHSRLKYAPKFTGEIREVFLTGEAHFEVVKKAQPFLVQTGKVTTKVLGTSFVVRAYEADRRVTVQVRSGKVSVYTNEKQTGTAAGITTKGVILTANQAAVFEEKEKQLSKTLVVQPILLRPEVIINHFEYDETPLPQVVKQLEQAYGIHFQFDGEVLKNCKITATLSNESLYDKLNLLCKITGATYEIVDGQIIIDAQGCQ